MLCKPQCGRGLARGGFKKKHFSSLFTALLGLDGWGEAICDAEKLSRLSTQREDEDEFVGSGKVLMKTIPESSGGLTYVNPVGSAAESARRARNCHFTVHRTVNLPISADSGKRSWRRLATWLSSVGE